MSATLADRLAEIRREKLCTTAGIGIAMLWLLEDGQSDIVRKMSKDMNLFSDDFRQADDVERIASNGWGLDDLLNALD